MNLPSLIRTRVSFRRLLPVLLTVLALVVLSRTASAQSTIFFVRHAERADSGSGEAPKMATDPDLSAAGRARAQSLATVLKDAKITSIFTTEYKRTQQTAAPLAKALGLTITPVSSKDMAHLVKQLKAVAGNALVVGHSNTVPDVIKALGAPPPAQIADDEFDNLYVLTQGPAPVVLRLHYK
jgi:broad specificity phosphatase PhoE